MVGCGVPGAGSASVRVRLGGAAVMPWWVFLAALPVLWLLGLGWACWAYTLGFNRGLEEF